MFPVPVTVVTLASQQREREKEKQVTRLVNQLPTQPETPAAKVFGSSPEFDRAFAEAGKALERGFKVASFVSRHYVKIVVASVLTAASAAAFIGWVLYRIAVK